MFDQTDPEWSKFVAAITSGMKEWVEQHPKATLAEIERVNLQLSRLLFSSAGLCYGVKLNIPSDFGLFPSKGGSALGSYW